MNTSKGVLLIAAKTEDEVFVCGAPNAHHYDASVQLQVLIVARSATSRLQQFSCLQAGSDLFPLEQAAGAGVALAITSCPHFAFRERRGLTFDLGQTFGRSCVTNTPQ